MDHSFAMECEKCGSTEFHEETGFYFCLHCQTQSQGFAKEVADDEEEFFFSKEVNIKKENDGGGGKSASGKKRKRRDLTLNSKWTSIEAYNEVYLAMIQDFFAILEEHNCAASRKRFLEVSMQIWLEYLRQCEIIFRPDEHINKMIKLHPAARPRDNFLLGNFEKDSKEPEPEHVPMYSHIKHEWKEEPVRLKYGKVYTTRAKNRAVENEAYYRDEQHSVQYYDPRKYSVSGALNTSIGPTYLAETLESVKKEAESGEESDQFISFIKSVVKGKMGSPLLEIKKKFEEEDQVETEITVEQFNATLPDNGLLDNQNFDEILEQRLPTTSKVLHQKVGLSRLKAYKNADSPLMNDQVTKPKLLAFLFITIRLLNCNVYLSDLIRWCVQGNIRYIDALQCLPASWEIMWIDVNSFKEFRCPAYHTMIGLVRHMVDHCHLSLELFPAPDILPLVRRYIRDLNLPDDLIDVVTKRYGSFVHQETCANRPLRKVLPEAEIIAIIAIILTLRDLFDLEGTTEEFPTVQDCNAEDLFVWSKWYEYSRTRLNAIKTCILNLPVDFNNNLYNIDEILTVSNNFFSPVKVAAKSKSRQNECRAELSESFNKLFDGTGDRVKSKLSEKIPATLYPLTTYTDLVRTVINNSLVESTLRQNFTRTQVTPYTREDGTLLHKPATILENEKFSYKKYVDFFNLHISEPFAHLMDLAALITVADLKRYFYLFREAEASFKNLKKLKRRRKIFKEYHFDSDSSSSDD